jgi:hypothetical protein
MTDIPASLADLDNPDDDVGRNEPPQTEGSSALAPVVRIGGKRQPSR